MRMPLLSPSESSSPYHCVEHSEDEGVFGCICCLGFVYQDTSRTHLEHPCPALLAVGNILRIANRYRSAMLPKDPQDLSFTTDNSYIPHDFLHFDTSKHGQHHLIFHSPDCLHLLSIAKSWYIDGAFAVVSIPFNQLLKQILALNKCP